MAGVGRDGSGTWSGSPTSLLREHLDSDDDVQPLLNDQTSKVPRDNVDKQNEDSPLLEPYKPDDEEMVGDEAENGTHIHEGREDSTESKSTWYLFILTLSIGGLQIAWATELSNGSPYLLSLGISKALLALVWIAGPLTGVLVQPYIGILSDRSRTSWGKRRPFMVGGAVGTIISLIALAWAREIVGGILSLFGADPKSDGVKTTTIVFAVLWVYVLDFAINAVQAAIRAFIVDNAPTHQQEDANAWASRITGFGNILGYLSGSADLPKIFPFFGDTQFKVLCVFSAMALGGTVMISCLYIRERDPSLEGPPPTTTLGIKSFVRQTFKAFSQLPPQIRKICEVQFFNWIGWFPFLFYITTYIGQLKVNPIFEDHPNLPPNEVDDQWKAATRTGSIALLVYAITSFISSIVLPVLIAPSYQEYRPRGSVQYDKGPTSVVLRYISKIRISYLTLRRAWMYSHILFALCMLSTFFITTPLGGIIMAAFVGISWALTMWAPFALISAEISKRDPAKRYNRESEPRLNSSMAGSDGRNIESPDDGSGQAGVVLGLHNVAISAPQILTTLISSGIFKFAQRDRGSAGDDSVGWVLRFGGLAAVVAAGMTWRIDEERDETEVLSSA